MHGPQNYNYKVTEMLQGLKEYSIHSYLECIIFIEFQIFAHFIFA